eukprot:TRINITY_DN11553_c0_g1_i1.p1 TRINITY_DN11553_c0_g1~~TRINITY_DN11553_c0_g1_i1.p1  ORF type:complete len:1232 (-),score=375.72 TRINITY_DN11553_c0_g1_i1:54-3749(-)
MRGGRRGDVPRGHGGGKRSRARRRTNHGGEQPIEDAGEADEEPPPVAKKRSVIKAAIGGQQKSKARAQKKIINEEVARKIMEKKAQRSQHESSAGGSSAAPALDSEIVARKILEIQAQRAQQRRFAGISGKDRRGKRDGCASHRNQAHSGALETTPAAAAALEGQQPQLKPMKHLPSWGSRPGLKRPLFGQMPSSSYTAGGAAGDRPAAAKRPIFQPQSLRQERLVFGGQEAATGGARKEEKESAIGGDAARLGSFAPPPRKQFCAAAAAAATAEVDPDAPMPSEEALPPPEASERQPHQQQARRPQVAKARPKASGTFHCLRFSAEHVSVKQEEEAVEEAEVPSAAAAVEVLQEGVTKPPKLLVGKASAVRRVSGAMPDVSEDAQQPCPAAAPLLLRTTPKARPMLVRGELQRVQGGRPSAEAGSESGEAAKSAGCIGGNRKYLTAKPKPPATPPPLSSLTPASAPAKQTAIKQPPAKRPPVMPPAAKQPLAKPPVAKRPAVKPPVAKRPVAKQPVAKQPVAKHPTAMPPATNGAGPLLGEEEPPTKAARRAEAVPAPPHLDEAIVDAPLSGPSQASSGSKPIARPTVARKPVLCTQLGGALGSSAAPPRMQPVPALAQSRPLEPRVAPASTGSGGARLERRPSASLGPVSPTAGRQAQEHRTAVAKQAPRMLRRQWPSPENEAAAHEVLGTPAKEEEVEEEAAEEAKEEEEELPAEALDEEAADEAEAEEEELPAEALDEEAAEEAEAEEEELPAEALDEEAAEEAEAEEEELPAEALDEEAADEAEAEEEELPAEALDEDKDVFGLFSSEPVWPAEAVAEHAAVEESHAAGLLQGLTAPLPDDLETPQLPGDFAHVTEEQVEATLRELEEEEKLGAPSEYLVELDKMGGMRLGINIEGRDGISLYISHISDGLVENWNAANPDRQMMVGDRVVEVNGLTGDAQVLSNELRRSEVLTMRVRRKANITTLPPGWQAILDEASGKVFYANHDAGVAQWDMPTGEEQQDGEEEEVAVASEADSVAAVGEETAFERRSGFVDDGGPGFAWPRYGEDESAAASSPVASLPEEVQAALTSGLPTEAAAVALCDWLDEASLQAGSAIECLRKLYDWLWSDHAPQLQALAQMSSGRLEHQLVSLTGAGAGRATGYWACHVMGRVVFGHSDNAMTFVTAGAIGAVAELVQRHWQDVEVHMAAVTALQSFAVSPAVQGQVASSGVVCQLQRAIEGFETG